MRSLGRLVLSKPPGGMCVLVNLVRGGGKGLCFPSGVVTLVTPGSGGCSG